MHVCPLVTGLVPHVGGPVAIGCPTVMIGGMPAARVGDMVVCVGPPDTIAMGSTGVFIGGMPAARMGDMTVHAGSIVIGMPNVMIGEIGPGPSMQMGAMESHSWKNVHIEPVDDRNTTTVSDRV